MLICGDLRFSGRPVERTTMLSTKPKTAEIIRHNSLKPSESHACSILTMTNRLHSLDTM